MSLAMSAFIPASLISSSEGCFRAETVDRFFFIRDSPYAAGMNRENLRWLAYGVDGDAEHHKNFFGLDQRWH
jgi:hypothetical protein